MTAPWPLLPSALALIGMAGVIVVVGIRLTKVADALAERTGLGDAGPSTAESSGRFARWGRGVDGDVLRGGGDRDRLLGEPLEHPAGHLVLDDAGVAHRHDETRRQLGPVVSAQLSVARTKTRGSTSARPTG